MRRLRNLTATAALLAEGDRLGRSGEGVAAVPATLAEQEALLPELEQNQLEELARHVLLLGDVADEHHLALGLAGQHQEGAQSVLGLLRKQVDLPYPSDRD